MADKYGFGGGIDLPVVPQVKKNVSKTKPQDKNLAQAVKAGEGLGFVSREPSPKRRKPGPKRKEPQDKVSIPGPKRVIDEFRKHCEKNNFTLWEGLNDLLEKTAD